MAPMPPNGTQGFPGGAAVGAILADSPWPVAGPGGVLALPTAPQQGLGGSFPNMFGNSDMSLQDIADKAHQLQQKIDENAEQEKATLRASAEAKHVEIERHAAELARTAASSIEAYKTAQLQTAERQKAYQQAIIRQQTEQAKRLVDQQSAQAIAAVEARDRQLDLQRRQQDLQCAAPLHCAAPTACACGALSPMQHAPPPMLSHSYSPPMLGHGAAFHPVQPPPPPHGTIHTVGPPRSGVYA